MAITPENDTATPSHSSGRRRLPNSAQERPMIMIGVAEASSTPLVAVVWARPV
jgi:hypothetical protein